MSTKNKGRGRPPVDSEMVRARMPRDLLDGLDAWAADQADAPERSEALRRILRDFLKRRGFL